MRESSIEQTLQREVKKRGGIMYKWVSPGRAGVPDRIAIFPGGRIVFVEVKRPGGIVSPKQSAIIQKLRALGAKVWVIDDLQVFRERLDNEI